MEAWCNMTWHGGILWCHQTGAMVTGCHVDMMAYPCGDQVVIDVRLPAHDEIWEEETSEKSKK